MVCANGTSSCVVPAGCGGSISLKRFRSVSIIFITASAASDGRGKPNSIARFNAALQVCDWGGVFRISLAYLEYEGPCCCSCPNPKYSKIDGINQFLPQEFLPQELLYQELLL